jgi:hypothetical protein
MTHMRNLYDLFQSWDKSTFSAGGAGSSGGCVNVGTGHVGGADVIGVGDTKQDGLAPGSRTVLLPSRAVFARFIDNATAGKFTPAS